MRSSSAYETNLNSLSPWNKDIAQQAGQALSPKPLKSGKRNVRLATTQH